MSMMRQSSRRIAAVDCQDGDNSNSATSNTPSSAVLRNRPAVPHHDSLRNRADSVGSAVLNAGEADDNGEPQVATITTLLNYLVENSQDLLKNQVKMKRFEQITAEVVNSHDDPALHRVVKQHGWNGNKYPRQIQAALDTDSYQRALVNLYLSQRKGYDGIKSNIPVEESTESEKIVSFLPDLLVNHLTNSLVIEQSGDISCSTFFGAALLVDISGFSMFAAEKCSHGVAGLNDLHDATNGFLGHLVHIVYRYGGDVVAFAGDALICVFVEHPPPQEFEDEISPSNIRVKRDFDSTDLIDQNDSGWRSASKKQSLRGSEDAIDISYTSDDDLSGIISHPMSKKQALTKTTDSEDIIDRNSYKDANDLNQSIDFNTDTHLPMLHSLYEGSKSDSTDKQLSMDMFSMDSPFTASQVMGLKPSDTPMVNTQSHDDYLSDSATGFPSPLKYRPYDQSSQTPRKHDVKSAKLFNGDALGVINRVMSRKGTFDGSIRKNSDDQSIRSHRSSVSESTRLPRVGSVENPSISTDTIRKGSMLYLDKLEESNAEYASIKKSNRMPISQPKKIAQHVPKTALDHDPYLFKNCCLRSLECALLLREQSAHSGILTTHIAVSYGEMKLAILGGHNDDWVYLLNGECISELGPCLTAAAKKQVVATKKCYEMAMQSDFENLSGTLGTQSSIPDLHTSISDKPGSLSSRVTGTDPRITVSTDLSPDKALKGAGASSIVKPKGYNQAMVSSTSSPIVSPVSAFSMTDDIGAFNPANPVPSEIMNDSGNIYLSNSATYSFQRSNVSNKAPIGNNLSQSAMSLRKQNDMLSPKISSFGVTTVATSSSFNLGSQAIVGPLSSSTDESIISPYHQPKESNRSASPNIVTKQVGEEDLFVIESIESDRIPAENPMRLKRILHNSPPTVVDAAKLFVSRPVLSAIYSDSLDRTAELRQVVTMFVSLDSYSPADHKDPLELQPFFKVVQEALHQSGGYLRQFVVDDKGCVVVAMWGVPQFSYSNNCLRGLFCGVAISKRSQELQLKTSVGLTSGYCYCGCVGGQERRDYAIIGDQVNMAARFMSKANGRVLMDMPFKTSLPSNIQNQLSRAETMKLKGASKPVNPFVFIGDEIPVSEVLEDHEGQTTVLRRHVRVMLSAQLDKVSNDSYLVDQAKQNASLSMKSVRMKPSAGSSGTENDRIIPIYHAIATVIIGLPGTGKSTAAQYFEQESRKRNIDCIKIQARPGDEMRPYSVIRKLFLELIGIANFREERHQRAVIKDVIKKAYPLFEYDDEKRNTAELTLEIILGLEWSEAFRTNHDDDNSSNLDASEHSYHSAAGLSVNGDNNGNISPIKKRLRLQVGDCTFYNVLKALLHKRKTVIIIEDADYCDELSWNEFYLILDGIQLQLAIMLTMRTPPSNRSREYEERFTSSSHAPTRNQNTRNNRSNENVPGESKGLMRAFSTMGIFKETGFRDGGLNGTLHGHDDQHGHKNDMITITRASGETIQVPITEFSNVHHNPTVVNPMVEIGASKYGIRFRPNNAYVAILSHERCKVIEMNPLNDLEINELLHEALGIDVVDRELVMSVLEVTAGNAFWCKAIAKFIKENTIEEYSRTIVRRGGNFNSLRALILNRIDRLTDEQRNVAKHAAIIGDQFTLTVLKAILPSKIQTHLTSSLDALQQNGLVYCVEEAHDVVFCFQNQLIRNTIYDLTPPTDADYVHLTVAELLEYQYADDLRQHYQSLSYHYRNSVRNNDEKRGEAFKYTVKAADQAISKASYPDGLAFLQLAVPFAQGMDEYRTLLEVVRTALEDLAPTRYENIFNKINGFRNRFFDSRSNADSEAEENVRHNIQNQYLKLQGELYKAMNKAQNTDSSDQTGSNETGSRPNSNFNVTRPRVTPQEPQTIESRVLNMTQTSNNQEREPRSSRFFDALGCMSTDTSSSQVPTLVNELSYVRTRHSKGRSACVMM